MIAADMPIERAEFNEFKNAKKIAAYTKAFLYTYAPTCSTYEIFLQFFLKGERTPIIYSIMIKKLERPGRIGRANL